MTSLLECAGEKPIEDIDLPVDGRWDIGNDHKDDDYGDNDLHNDDDDDDDDDYGNIIKIMDTVSVCKVNDLRSWVTVMVI